MLRSLAFIEGLGGPELMMIMFIVLLLFGANKLPELAKGLGKSVREFKKATDDVENEVRRAMETHEEPPHRHSTLVPFSVDATGNPSAPESPTVQASVEQPKISDTAKR